MDKVTRDRDQAMCQPGFGGARMAASPGSFRAGGPAKMGGKTPCVVINTKFRGS